MKIEQFVSYAKFIYESMNQMSLTAAAHFRLIDMIILLDDRILNHWLIDVSLLGLHFVYIIEY